MIRDFALADFITLANGVAGLVSIFAVLNYLVKGERVQLQIAMAMLPLAGLFDYLDGRVARWRRRHSDLGAQLDSLADLVSFGVAPAVLGYGLGLRGGLDLVLLVYFVSCGLSRLARYNATATSLADDSGKVKYFEGTPIPTSILLVGGCAWLFSTGRIGAALPWGSLELLGFDWHPISLVYFISGSAMISKTLHVPKF